MPDHNKMITETFFLKYIHFLITNNLLFKRVLRAPGAWGNLIFQFPFYTRILKTTLIHNSTSYL